MNGDMPQESFTKFVRSKLEFGESLWKPYLKKPMEQLERMQKMGIRIMPKLACLGYEERVKTLQ